MKQKQLKELANELSDKILKTLENSTFFESPFKHCVIDDFFDTNNKYLRLINLVNIIDSKGNESK